MKSNVEKSQVIYLRDIVGKTKEDNHILFIYSNNNEPLFMDRFGRVTNKNDMIIAHGSYIKNGFW